MNKARIIKSALCMTSAITVMVAANAAPAEASNTNTKTNSSEVTLVSSVAEYSNNSLAGISLSLDKYYTLALDESVDLLRGDAANSGLAALNSKDVATKGAEATATPAATPAATVAPTEKPVSKYVNTGISIADNYVNIRSKASTDGEIVGKLYTGAAATIVKAKGNWVQIKSGSVTGYIKKEFLAIGEAAEKVASKYGKKTATVSTTTIRLREKASVDSRTLALLAEGESYPVSKTDDKWAKVTVDDVKGYLSLEYVDVDVKFDKAVSIEEEEKAAQEEAAKENNSSSNASNNSSSGNSNSGSSSGSSSGSGSSGSSSSSDDDDYSGSVSGSAVVSYAKKFLGNPYVYGGNSLTRGTDCSGFTKLVYAHFGYSLPRSSSAQRSAGKRVSMSNLKAGDLILYSGHVGIYIGGGRIIHASTSSSGIIITSMYYGSRPIGARRIIY